LYFPLAGPGRPEVLNWSGSVVTVRIPKNAEEGEYKVGIYCPIPGRPDNALASAGWLDFAVVASP
jgi:hypothetical protein